jgi:hypothetical protein
VLSRRAVANAIIRVNLIVTTARLISIERYLIAEAISSFLKTYIKVRVNKVRDNNVVLLSLILKVNPV